MSTGIYAKISAAKQGDLNAVFVALQYGPDVFSQKLTTEDPPTENSAVTDYGMYNAAARAQDISDYASAKAGDVLPLDMNGNPVAWGVGGVISEADAFAAFADLQFWVNDSEVSSATFAATCRGLAGLYVVPEPR